MRRVSMDLYVWKHPFTTDEDEAQRLITREDESVFGPSPELEQFYAELMELFPPPEAFSVEEQEQNPVPWADSPHGSDRLVWLSIRWSAKDEDLDTIVELARKHDLVLYDPQGPSLPLAGRRERGRPVRPGRGRLRARRPPRRLRPAVGADRLEGVDPRAELDRDLRRRVRRLRRRVHHDRGRGPALA